MRLVTLSMAVGLVILVAVQPASAATPAQPAPLTARYADPAQPDISGIWVLTGAFNFAAAGVVPKLLGEYKALYDKRTAAIKSGIAIDDVTADCLPAGMPHLLVVPYPFEIMQTPGQVTFIYEYGSVVRRVPLTGTDKLVRNDDAVTFHGNSGGRWESDTLVIDTINIRADTQLDFTGVPHSDQLRVTERLRRKDATTIEDQITLTDPKAYAEPFTVTHQYRLRPKWKKTIATPPMPRGAPPAGCQSHDIQVNGAVPDPCFDGGGYAVTRCTRASLRRHVRQYPAGHHRRRGQGFPVDQPPRVDSGAGAE
jgi:hypothetical protein